MTINFYYNTEGACGEMEIYLESFLGDRNITRFRSLLKIIRMSESPECEQQIKDYINDYNDRQYFLDRWEEQKAINRCDDNIRDCEIAICDINKELEEQTESAEELKEARQALKDVRRELKEERERFYKAQKKLLNTERYKVFLEKCLKLLKV